MPCRYYSIQISLSLTFFSFAPLPKSADTVRVASNADIYDFELSAEDVTGIDALDRGKDGTVTWNPVDVD